MRIMESVEYYDSRDYESRMEIMENGQAYRIAFIYC